MSNVRRSNRTQRIPPELNVPNVMDPPRRRRSSTQSGQVRDEPNREVLSRRIASGDDAPARAPRRQS